MNPDFKDLLLAFNEGKVEYLIVGAHAVAYYGHVRATKDLDIWIRSDEENARKVIASLMKFGAPLDGLTVGDLTHKDTIFQMGLPPLRIDLLTAIDGVEFEDAWSDRQSASLGEVVVQVISRQHLITNKQNTGRLQDLADIEHLEALDKE
jgi:hypothetical protein